MSNFVGKVEKRARKPWITQEIVSKMDERRKWKSVNNEEGLKNYRRLNNELRRATDTPILVHRTHPYTSIHTNTHPYTSTHQHRPIHTHTHSYTSTHIHAHPHSSTHTHIGTSYIQFKFKY
jgi:hypothetical protein